uniref:ATP-dependent DNA helicase n=1 Tax=Mycena chlorophos TaxID=658473 RepID=A0ABQ0KXA3_MYCCL|nr:transcriptional factor B3 [Mycena chlorophos]
MPLIRSSADRRSLTKLLLNRLAVLSRPLDYPLWPAIDSHEQADSNGAPHVVYIGESRLGERSRNRWSILDGFSCPERLFQRYLVDMWASADQNRLTWLKRNQGTIRAELYRGLANAIEEGDENIDMNSLGMRTVLPSSYMGGPCDCGQRFQDSIALARYYRSVDLFITVTTNSKWPEITRELLSGQHASDRPDLVARVFHLKKHAIIEDIHKNGIFGISAAYVYAIEFQKRGLPHMHLLLFLQPGHKLLTLEDIDSAIRAYWPDPEKEPLLFETVKKCMVHGPCGRANPSSPCMENGQCTMVDNSWIIPYSPYLSAKYNCHINVECAVSLGSFKYAFKYIQKGGDKAGMQVANRNDKIMRFLEGRYVSAAEAAWRTFHFEMFEQLPNVVRLQVHLPGQHLVRFDPTEDATEVLERAAGELTTLTGFFTANANPQMAALASRYMYQEFPQFFTWRKVEGVLKWRPGERFYMRTLLTVVKGARSFEDLRTYNGTVHSTFLQACLARGLLEDDGEWRQCLQEAGEMQMGTWLRQLFATLLVFCKPSQPGLLWAEFRENICDDLLHRLQRTGRPASTQDDAYDYGLYLLNDLGKSLDEWADMPQPQINWEHEADIANPLIADQLNYDLNEQRRNDSVRSTVQTQSGETFFLNGPGGTGKTFVYKTFCYALRAEARIVLCVASSGIAALLMPGGRTAYSMFKIPIDSLFDGSFCNIPKNSQRAELTKMFP